LTQKKDKLGDQTILSEPEEETSLLNIRAFSAESREDDKSAVSDHT
tara:strand:+ start:1374 stop:1511 length:138 start_codon:yes stop_codon:yes gene_type:complete